MNSDSILYIGVDDHELDLFESQYVVPNGVSYNSYVIMDDKIAVMDTTDGRKVDEWLENLSAALQGRTPDYLVVHHMEPDHSSAIKAVAERYPAMQLVGNAKTFAMAQQFFGEGFQQRQVVVKEGDTLELGHHTLQFFTAPMMHWPEVMVSYESTEKVLFSADGFGKFGTLDTREDWDCEARRYYFNIMGKYGAQVRSLLKKTAALDIRTICPLHGPILTGDLSHYLELYDIWSGYRPENKGVLVACASIHGHTRDAARLLADKLSARGETVAFADMTRDDMAEAVEDAFRYDRMVVACCTYDGGLFPPAEEFIAHLKAKSYQSRTVGLMENGSWAPAAGKLMKAAFEGMKNITVLEPVVSIRSALNADSEAAMDRLAEELTRE